MVGCGGAWTVDHRGLRRSGGSKDVPGERSGPVGRRGGPGAGGAQRGGRSRKRTPTVRAYGLIKDDGSFELETLRAGVLQSGAAEGKYRVPVALSDDDPEARNRATQAVNPRFLTFDSSGLSIQVPNNDPVAVVVSRQ